jgi:ADP-ribose pyrophosphatase
MKIIGTSKFDGKYLHRMETIYEYLDKNGQAHMGKWEWVSRSHKAVVVAAIHVDEKGVERLVVTDEYRIPINSREHGFPAGLLEDGLSPEETVAKELFEETGLKLTKILDIPTPFSASSPGMTDEMVKVVYCYCEGTPSRDFLEGSEDINTHLMTWEDLDRLLRNPDVIISGKSIGIITSQWMQRKIGWILSSKFF